MQPKPKIPHTYAVQRTGSVAVVAVLVVVDLPQRVQRAVGDLQRTESEKALAETSTIQEQWYSALLSNPFCPVSM